MTKKIPDNLPKKQQDETFSQEGEGGPLDTAWPPPRMDIGNFNMPVGGGSWFNLSPKNIADWSSIKHDKEYFQDLKRQRELAQIRQLILNNPELAGQDPEAWDLKGIQMYLRLLKSKETNPIKIAKDKATIEGTQLRNEELRKKIKEEEAMEDMIQGTNKTGTETADDVVNRFGI